MRFSPIWLFIFLFIIWKNSSRLVNSELSESEANYVKLRYKELSSVRRASVNTNVTELGLTNIRELNTDHNSVPIVPHGVSKEVELLWGRMVRNDTRPFPRNLGAVLSNNRHWQTNVTRQLMPLPSGAPELRENYGNKDISGGVELNDLVYSVGDCHGIVLSLSDGQGPDLYGLYYESDGTFVASSNSLKFNGHIAPPFMLSRGDVNSKAKFEYAINISTRLEEKSLDLAERDGWDQRYNLDNARARSCEYLVFGAVKQLNITQRELGEIESELASPRGKPIPPIPDVELEMIVYSPDCGSISLHSCRGPRIDVYNSTFLLILTAGAVLLLSLALILGFQTNGFGSASAISKISFYTLLPQYAMDVETLFLALSLPRQEFFVAKCILMLLAGGLALTEGRYMVAVLVSQSSSQGEADFSGPVGRDELTSPEAGVAPTPSHTGDRPSAEDTVNANSSRSSLLRGSTTESPGANAIAGQPYHYTEESASGHVFQMLGPAILMFMTLALMIIVSDTFIWLRGLVLALIYSFWIPQVWRNTLYAFRSPVSFTWAVCVSIIRMIPALYYFVSAKVLVEKPRQLNLCVLLILWMAFQLTLLGIQSTEWWSRFATARLHPNCYDYHPYVLDLTNFRILPGNISRQELNDGLAAEMQEYSTSGRHQSWQRVECMICMVDVDVVPPVALLNTQMLDQTRSKYMITPCHHCFHQECLSQWLHSRLQCPICRKRLPPM